MYVRTRTFQWTLILSVVLAGCGGEDQQDTSEAPANVEGVGAGDAGPDTGESAVTLCAAHAVLANVCILCDPANRDSQRLWCREHARYEDRCWLCHPELRDTDRLYCDEHGLYEDECFYCHPDLLKSSLEGSAPGTSTASPELFCNEHGVPELECGICQPALADRLSPGEGLKIRLPSLDAARKAGVVSSPINNDSKPKTMTVPGELRFNQNRLARITLQVGGVVRAVRVDLGEDVAAGEALVEISSPAIAEAKAALLQAGAEELVAQEQFEREESLHGQGVSSEQELYEARARHTAAAAARRTAAQQLLGLGLRDEDVAGIEHTGVSDSRLVLRAPLSGTIIERQVVVGDVVAIGDRLLALCDLDMLWLDLSVPEVSAARLSPGAPVVITPPSLGRSFTGEVSWIADQLDPTTRLVRVRARFPNLDRLLKAGMYVDADVMLGRLESVVSVGRDAVHRFGGHPFVFVELKPDLYEVRRVDLGGEVDDQLKVVAGLDPTDRLVVGQSYLIKSEFQKSRLGAGCVD
jgi:cobalt-zinc-cadmium efflux system membrane fusion protein